MDHIPLPLEVGDLSHALPSAWTSKITSWLAEDTPSFDYGGFVVGDAPKTATDDCNVKRGCCRVFHWDWSRL